MFYNDRNKTDLITPILRNRRDQGKYHLQYGQKETVGNKSKIQNNRALHTTQSPAKRIFGSAQHKCKAFILLAYVRLSNDETI
jgi:hypothetical protein